VERSGAISGYLAQLDAGVLGLTFEALVFVTMRYEDRDTVAAFERAVVDLPNVLRARRLFGDPDYLPHVVTGTWPRSRSSTTNVSPRCPASSGSVHAGDEERRGEPSAAVVMISANC
jgi:DNA-binding Lrp family transcriptional regulator